MFEYLQTFEANVFIPAMITISTINLYRLVPLSISLTMAEGHKISKTSFHILALWSAHQCEISCGIVAVPSVQPCMRTA